eukprot:716200-Pleurochrysis_carterae.AAC.1
MAGLGVIANLSSTYRQKLPAHKNKERPHSHGDYWRCYALLVDVVWRFDEAMLTTPAALRITRKGTSRGC